jgi:hypothetical protein
MVEKFSNTYAHERALFYLGNRYIMYHANRHKAWEYYERLVEEYPNREYAQAATKYWAQVSKLPDAELRRQADNINQQEREAKAREEKGK